ncbi:GNAT family N-acetyltransferase [Halomonas sp. C05BenzN]|uniref:GNAT family N-acetyltransferase n=1 Tax=Halomonas sp. C05BenzN TaxID=3411041 RepID=UPI003B944BA4
MALSRLIRRLQGPVAAAAMLARNLLRARRLAPVEPRTQGDYRFEGMGRRHLAGALALYAGLHDGKPLDPARRLLYRLAGGRLGVVALDPERRVVAAGFYGFSPRDLHEGRVHAAFSGVLPAHRGRGLATEVRRTAILHFRANGLTGYSSRISADNVASLKASHKLGFRVVDRYTDAARGEARCYLVCDFDNDFRDSNPRDADPTGSTAADRDSRLNPAKDSAR